MLRSSGSAFCVFLFICSIFGTKSEVGSKNTQDQSITTTSNPTSKHQVSTVFNPNITTLIPSSTSKDDSTTPPPQLHGVTTVDHLEDVKVLTTTSRKVFTSQVTRLPPATTTELSIIIKKMKESPGVNSAIDAILILVVIQTMIGLGCTMDLALIKEHLLQPNGLIIAAACQFGFMPLIAFLMAKIFALNKVAAIAVLVTGCCPGGNLSNLLTYFFYGDMNLSILMSTISTMLALVFMPLCLFAYGSSWIEVSVIGRMIPFGGVVLTLILTLFPVAVGIAIKARYEKIANTLLKVSLCSVMVSFVALLTLSIILFGTSVFTAISGTSYVIAFVMPLIGYGSGYLLATLFYLPDASRRTVAIETGCQNSQLSSTILKMAFATETMGAYFLFPIYYALFQGLEGLGMILAFRAYRRYYADDVMVPTSRVLYDKFDEEFDGEDSRYNGGLYQNSPGNSSDSFGKLAIAGVENEETRPNKLQLKSNISTEMSNERNANQSIHGDKSSLLPSDQRHTSGVLDYGGLKH